MGLRGAFGMKISTLKRGNVPLGAYT